jgi:hypothetical protein
MRGLLDGVIEGSVLRDIGLSQGCPFY